MDKFGDYLLARSVITFEQREAGLHSMQVHGGRLGTNLVELGYLRLEELAAHLAEFFRVPLPPVDWVQHPHPQAMRLLPVPLVRRFKILPLHVEPSRIHVAMIDPTDEAQLDFVAQAADREVVPYVLPEVRILYWLEVHLGIDRLPRYVNLAARSRSTGEFGMRQLEAPAADATELEAEEASPPSRPHVELDELWEEEEEEILLEEIVQEVAEAPASVPAPRPVSSEPGARVADSYEVAQLEARMMGSTSRDDIAEIALRLARVYSQAAALFLVRNRAITGFMASGEGIDAIDDMVVPQDAPSLFARPAETKDPFRGPPPEDGMDGRLMIALGRPECHEVVVVPISLRGRVVNLLYADNGGDVFGETSVAALGAVARTMSRAYERMILDKKKQR